MQKPAITSLLTYNLWILKLFAQTLSYVKKQKWDGSRADLFPLRMVAHPTHEVCYHTRMPGRTDPSPCKLREISQQHGSAGNPTHLSSVKYQWKMKSMIIRAKGRKNAFGFSRLLHELGRILFFSSLGINVNFNASPLRIGSSPQKETRIRIEAALQRLVSICAVRDVLVAHIRRSGGRLFLC